MGQNNAEQLSCQQNMFNSQQYINVATPDMERENENK
jgi:hypothetical protein